MKKTILTTCSIGAMIALCSSCSAPMTPDALVQQATKKTQSTTQKRILKGTVDDVFTVTSVRNEVITVEMDWWDRLGRTRETVFVSDIKLAQASVSYIKTGPFNGLYKVHIPTKNNHTLYRWHAHKGRTTARLADESKSVNGIELYTLKKDGAHKVVSTIQAMQGGANSKPATTSNPISEAALRADIARQRKALEIKYGQKNVVGLFDVKNRKTGKTIKQFGYISPLDEGMTYEQSFEDKTKKAIALVKELGAGHYINLQSF